LVEKALKEGCEILLLRTALLQQKNMKIAVAQVEKKFISMNDQIKVMKFK
jgi:hypothetical protein